MTFEFETTVTVAQLAARFKKTAEDPDIIRVHGEALELLTDATVSAFRTIGPETCDDLFLRVARACWDGVKQMNGQASGTQVEGQAPVRAPRDPLREVEPILSRYIVMGLG